MSLGSSTSFEPLHFVWFRDIRSEFQFLWDFKIMEKLLTCDLLENKGPFFLFSPLLLWVYFLL